MDPFKLADYPTWVRVIAVIGLVCICVAGVAIIFLPQPVKKWRPPQLPDKCTEVTMTLGGTVTISQTVADLNKRPFVATLWGTRLVMSLKDNRLYVTATITVDGSTSIETEGIIFSGNMPRGWERNFDDRAIEIVSEGQRPVFQLIYKDPENVLVNGIFYVGNGRIAAAFDEQGLFALPIDEGIKRVNLWKKPLFKYPDYKYHGKYAE